MSTRFPQIRVSPSSLGIYHTLMQDGAVTRTVASCPGCSSCVCVDFLQVLLYMFLVLSVWYKPKLTNVCVSQQRLRIAVPLTMVTFSCQVPREPFTLALLAVIVYLSCQSPRSVRCASICMHLVHLAGHWLCALAAPVPAFVFSSNNRWLQQHSACRASFAWCKSAHMCAVVISICAHQVCWIRAAEKGSPLGLIVLCFGTHSTTLFCIIC